MTEYLRKVSPLEKLDFDLKSLKDRPIAAESEFEETFEQEWANKSLFGWEEVLKSLDSAESLYCSACDKTF